MKPRTRTGPLYAQLSPLPAQVRALRGQTPQHTCCAAVYVSRRTWLAWESGTNRMPPGLWELAKIKLTLPA